MSSFRGSTFRVNCYVSWVLRRFPPLALDRFMWVSRHIFVGYKCSESFTWPLLYAVDTLQRLFLEIPSSFKKSVGKTEKFTAHPFVIKSIPRSYCCNSAENNTILRTRNFRCVSIYLAVTFAVIVYYYVGAVWFLKYFQKLRLLIVSFFSITSLAHFVYLSQSWKKPNKVST